MKSILNPISKITLYKLNKNVPQQPNGNEALTNIICNMKTEQTLKIGKHKRDSLIRGIPRKVSPTQRMPLSQIKSSQHSQNCTNEIISLKENLISKQVFSHREMALPAAKMNQDLDLGDNKENLPPTG